MKDFPIPVVAFGEDIQPAEDQDLEFMAFPKAEPLVAPLPPMDAAAEDRAAAAAVVDQLIESMRLHSQGGAPAPRLSLKAMAPSSRRVLEESLGEGEVSARVFPVGGATGWVIQETAFAGVWRVLREDARGHRIEDLLEADDMPLVVKEAAARQNGAVLDPARLPPNVLNARPIVDELRHHAKAWRPGEAAHVVNLSLLPFSEADHVGLDALLGEGAVAILSRGFGNCRIQSTHVPGIWRVRYYNSMNTLILDTIEVVDIPEAARAAAEDYEDSVERLAELLGWLREDA